MVVIQFINALLMFFTFIPLVFFAIKTVKATGDVGEGLKMSFWFCGVFSCCRIFGTLFISGEKNLWGTLVNIFTLGLCTLYAWNSSKKRIANSLTSDKGKHNLKIDEINKEYNDRQRKERQERKLQNLSYKAEYKQAVVNAKYPVSGSTSGNTIANDNKHQKEQNTVGASEAFMAAAKRSGVRTEDRNIEDVAADVVSYAPAATLQQLPDNMSTVEKAYNILGIPMNDDPVTE